MDFNGILGLTVQPQKMTSDEAVQMMEEYGYDKFVLDSDMSSSPSDPLSVPKTVHKLRLSGVEPKILKKYLTVMLQTFTKYDERIKSIYYYINLYFK